MRYSLAEENWITWIPCLGICCLLCKVHFFFFFGRLLRVDLYAMPLALPAPDVPATQRLALDCRTLLDHRGGKSK